MARMTRSTSPTDTPLAAAVGYLMSAPLADAQQLLAIGAIIVAQRGNVAGATATVNAVNNATGSATRKRVRKPAVPAPVAVPAPAATDAAPAMTLASAADTAAAAAPRRRGRPPVNRPAAVEPAPLPDQTVDE